MWQIDNHTPFRAAGVLALDVHGRRTWVVTVRGTFRVELDGSVTIAEDQTDPLRVAQYRGEDGASSLLYEAEVTAEKPHVDIIVNGTAYAPGGKPAKRVHVGLGTCAFTKTLTVVGDRVWRGKVITRPSEPEPFVTIPLTYERAFGGHDTTQPNPAKQRMFAANPVGTGIAVRRRDLVGQPVPNIEIPGEGPKAGPRAAGFGAVCSYWVPRAQYAGTYDAAWFERRKPLLPEDYDPRWLNCAPEDQQIRGRFAGGNRIDVVNMSPEGMFGFVVPKTVLGFRTCFAAGRRGPPQIEDHRSAIKTIIVEPDERRFIVVWQSAVECHAKFANLDETVVRIKRRV